MDLVSASWNAYLVPADTPPAVVDRLYKAFVRAAADCGVQERLAKMCVLIKVRNGVETRRFVHSEITRWRAVIESNGIRLEN